MEVSGNEPKKAKKTQNLVVFLEFDPLIFPRDFEFAAIPLEQLNARRDHLIRVVQHTSQIIPWRFAAHGILEVLRLHIRIHRRSAHFPHAGNRNIDLRLPLHGLQLHWLNDT